MEIYDITILKSNEASSYSWGVWGSMYPQHPCSFLTPPWCMEITPQSKLRVFHTVNKLV